jgi:hypothetical protein
MFPELLRGRVQMGEANGKQTRYCVAVPRAEGAHGLVVLVNVTRGHLRAT